MRNVRIFDLPHRVADKLLFVQHAVVPRVSRQPEAKQPRAHGLGLRGVGACVLVAVAPEDPPAVFHIQPQKKARSQQKKRGEPRGQEIEKIIHFCGHQPDVFVGRLRVAEHGVHGVDCLVEKSERRAADGEKQKRRNHAVGRIFRDGLDGSSGDTLLIEPVRVAADDHGNGLLRVGKRAGLQRGIDLHTLVAQRFRSENLPAHDALKRQPQPDGKLLREKQQKRRHGG